VVIMVGGDFSQTRRLLGTTVAVRTNAV